MYYQNFQHQYSTIQKYERQDSRSALSPDLLDKVHEHTAGVESIFEHLNPQTCMGMRCICMAQQSGIELRPHTQRRTSDTYVPTIYSILRCADGQQPGAYGLPDDGWDSAQRPGDKANLLCSAALRASTYSGLSGYIDYNEFKTVFSANLGPDALPFDFDWSARHASAAPLSPHSLSACSDWIKLYLGKKSGSHLMKGLQGERLRQAFKYLDTNEDGFIPALPEWLIQEGDWK
ncbi:hypothetical protein BJ912DRAFT_930461 [Pholiota molesta]|nr:hypothetical protein BJ912DRAFT_930461 [Pholiota molesta]